MQVGTDFASAWTTSEGSPTICLSSVDSSRLEPDPVQVDVDVDGDGDAVGDRKGTDRRVRSLNLVSRVLDSLSVGLPT